MAILGRLEDNGCLPEEALGLSKRSKQLAWRGVHARIPPLLRIKTCGMMCLTCHAGHISFTACLDHNQPCASGQQPGNNLLHPLHSESHRPLRRRNANAKPTALNVCMCGYAVPVCFIPDCSSRYTELAWICAHPGSSVWH